ncbi:MAG: hypothetical protein ABEJ86_05175 [Halococcoides sp.]
MRIDPVTTIAGGLDRAASAATLPVAGLLFVTYLAVSYGTLGGVFVGLPTAVLSQRWWVLVAVLGGLVSLWMGAGLLTLYGHVVAARTLGPNLPGDRSPFTRRIGRAMASTVALAVLLGPLAVGGTLLAVVPGVAVGTLGAFAVVAIAVEDRSTVDALERAWALGATDRVATVLLGTLLAVGAAIMVVGAILAIAVPVVGGLLRAALLTAVQCALVGIFVEATLRLREIRDFEVRVE